MMVGTPGSMLAAEAMLAWTGEQRWDDAWNAVSERVEAARDPDGLWTQRLGGQEARSLGPAHGYAGNMRALANRGRAPEPANLEPYVLREDGLANWQPREGARPTRSACSGATARRAWWRRSATCSTSSLALAGGELTWRAGPLAKGPPLPRHGRQRVRLPRPPPPHGR